MAKALHSDYFENEGPAHFAQLVMECLAGKTETQLYARTENIYALLISNGLAGKTETALCYLRVHLCVRDLCIQFVTRALRNSVYSLHTYMYIYIYMCI